MRRVMLLAAMLAMALAAAAPAFGQVSVVDQEADQFGAVDDSVCSQVYNIVVQQYNAGDQTAAAAAIADADATAGAFGTAAAVAVAGANAVNVANAAGIDIDTVNYCLNNFTAVAGEVQYKKTVTPVYRRHPCCATPTSSATSSATASATSSAATTLPNTGGGSLLALGAGALLVGGGLVARRIAR